MGKCYKRKRQSWRLSCTIFAEISLAPHCVATLLVSARTNGTLTTTEKHHASQSAPPEWCSRLQERPGWGGCRDLFCDVDENCCCYCCPFLCFFSVESTLWLSTSAGRVVLHRTATRLNSEQTCRQSVSYIIIFLPSPLDGKNSWRAQIVLRIPFQPRHCSGPSSQRELWVWQKQKKKKKNVKYILFNKIKPWYHSYSVYNLLILAKANQYH